MSEYNVDDATILRTGIRFTDDELVVLGGLMQLGALLQRDEAGDGTS